uniref:nitrile hydratase n=1 Tax=Arcella intermedia TaxID=1963864 RepID=A0A6B2L404_9EUKA
MGGRDGTPQEALSLVEKHALDHWEKQIDALYFVMTEKGLLNLHVFRRCIESLEDSVYRSASYFERWAFGLSQVLLEKGAILQGEIDERMGTFEKADLQPQFKVGDKVRVKYENYATRWRKPHLRTPGYIFGKEGVIERYCGIFEDPEKHAFWVSTQATQPLYRVRFNQKTVWPKYEGPEQDTIDLEITQNWLLPIEETPTAPLNQHKQDHHEHDHGHDHDHEGEEHDHVHQKRQEIEQNALNNEKLETALVRLAKVLIDLVLEKKIASIEEINAHIEHLDKLEETPLGAVLVAKAWTDPQFKADLLSNARNAAAKLNIEIKVITTVVENTDKVHNVVVCTLCSCYPKYLMGRPPSWYKSRSYRSRVVINPREVLKEFGTVIPEDVAIRVHDSNADLRYLVIPKRPQGTENWTQEELIKIITRDSMIGASVLPPQTPKEKN